MRIDTPGPYSLDALGATPVPILFTVDAQAWRAMLTAWFEQEAGRTLYPAQVETLLIDTLAYAMSVLGEEAQMVVEQHLVAKAGLVGLERLGPNRSTPRMPAVPARAMLRFSVVSALPHAVYIPAGTRVGTEGGAVFATLEEASIAAGSINIDVAAQAVEPGVGGNGWVTGQIAIALDPLPGVAVVNTSESSGGADAEDVELYRLRVANAFERISTGGSYAWYRETAMGASPAIVDVAVVRPQPCVIDIYPLTLAGAAASALRDVVAAAFDTRDALDIRFGDDVRVKPPAAVEGALTLVVRGRAMQATVEADASAAAQSVLKVWRERLGAIVAPSEIEAAVRRLPGVIDAEAQGLPFRRLAAYEYLVSTLTVVVEAVE